MNKPLRHSFYKRFSLILVLSVIGISVMVIRVERVLLIRDLEDKGRSIAQILSSVTLDAILSHDYAGMERYANDIVSAGFVSGISVVRNDGEVLAGHPLVAASDTLITEYPIRMGNAPYGNVRIAFSTARIDTITWRIVYAAFAVVAILHVLGLILTNLVLNKTVVRPLNRLQQAIMKVAGGDLSEKIEPAGPSEFNNIAESFNTMATRLSGSFAELEESRSNLDLEQKKLAAIVASIADGLFVTDNEAIIISFNDSAEKISGYTKQEALGRKCEDLFRSSLCADACALRHTGETMENIETTMVTKDDRVLAVAVSSAILQDREGNWIGGVQTFRDITEEKKRHELYCRTEKLAALGQLAAGVAHEMNNPLGNIIGYAKMIKPGDPPGKIGQRVEVIVEQARKCSDIVKGLLDYSRTSISEPALFDLNEIVSKVAEVLELQINKKGIDLNLELATLPMVLADSRKVEQLVLNLVLNAVQAVEQGGRISLRTWQEEDMVRLAVKDNGPGIPTELRCRIFDPFFTTKPVGEGTGLGLSICAGIIDELNGLIDIETTNGSGACLIISLPV